MALGYALDDNPHNINIGGFNLQDEYNFNDPQPPAAFDISQGKVTVIAFAQHDDADSLTFLEQLQSIYSANAGNNFNTVGILYEFEGSITAPEWAAALTAIGYDPATFYEILNNGAWGTGTPATDYLTNYGAAVASPVVYIISKYYTIAYKTQLSVHADVDAMITAISSKVADLLAGPTIISTTPAVSPATTTTIDNLEITFSEAVSNSGEASNYVIVNDVLSPGKGDLDNNPQTASPGGSNDDVSLNWPNGQSPGDGNILLRVNPDPDAAAAITDRVFHDPVSLDTTDLLFDIEIPTSDVYFRDHVNDDGVEPSTAYSQCPDIIVLNTAPTGDLQATYGGRRNDNPSIGEYQLNEVELGQDNYIVLRANNKGTVDATNVTANVYHAKYTTTLASEDWTLIGTTNPITIEPGLPGGGTPEEYFYVFDPIIWTQASVGDLDTTAHYCLIATIGSDTEHKPIDSDYYNLITNWSDFIYHIRAKNNIAFRNLRLVDKIQPPPEPAPGEPPPPPPSRTPDGEDPQGFQDLPFKFAGSPGKDQKEPSQLELVINLPKGSRAMLEVPNELMEELKKNTPGLKIVKVDEKRDVSWVHVNPYKTNTFGEIHLEPRSLADMRLFVQIPKEYIKGKYKVFARQIHKGLEIGRVAWFIGQGWKPQKKPIWIYRLLRWILDRIFMIKRIPWYRFKN